MGMSGPPSLGQSRRHAEPSADINVTPLVDVMLVLLVIFIITAPTLEKDSLPVQLPRTSTKVGGERSAYMQRVVVDESGKIQFGYQVFSPEQAVTELPKLIAAQHLKTVVLKAHRTLPYERVVCVMALLKQCGVQDVIVAIETPIRNPRATK